MKKVPLLLLCVVVISTIVNAQDSARYAQRKNTIKLDITSRWLYRNSLIMSYERVTKPNQSVGLIAGYQEFPRSSSLGDGISVKDDRKKNGMKFGAEYRFYLRKENKYRAPRGVYIGPYSTFLTFNNERTIEVNNDGVPEQVILNTDLNIFNVGFQLGYQFVIKNRWSIDIVFIGPSLSHYGYTAKLSGTYTFDKEDIQNEILLDLIDRFPFLDDLVTEKEADGQGRLDIWSGGYRYQLNVGYHFGRKK
jgi:Protein of unknown function (DUF3575)